jgi:hypothetical protein
MPRDRQRQGFPGFYEAQPRQSPTTSGLKIPTFFTLPFEITEADLDHITENRLQSITSLLDDAQRCILQCAFKGHITESNKERIETMLQSALDTAGRIQPTDPR